MEWVNKKELLSLFNGISTTYRYGPFHMAEQKQGDQLEPTYSSSVRLLGAVLRTCWMQWTIIGRGGERGSGISTQMAQQDDDRLFNTKIWFTGKCLIVIITIFWMLHFFLKSTLLLTICYKVSSILIQY